MKRWSPPSSAITSSPGRKWRWYVLPRTISAPSERTSSGSSILTVAFVPTGMNAGVRTSPWAVWRTPARASPSEATARYLMETPSRDRPFVESDGEATRVVEIASVLEPELLVVLTYAEIVPNTVQAEVHTPRSGGLALGPRDDVPADSPSRERAPNRQLVDVGGVGRAL